LFEHDDATPVSAAASYVVVSVNERVPQCLDDFLAGDVAKVHATSSGNDVAFGGPARREVDAVLIYVTDDAGTTEDIRIWRITMTHGRFEAVERAVY
jgi:hypothetical protein